MNADAYDSVDESRRQQFELKWQRGETPKIEDFLPAANDAKRIGTLEELVHIDMEFRWKHLASGAAAESVAPTAKSYLKRFPDLDQNEIVDRLVQGEFDLRHQFGDKPNAADFFAQINSLANLSHDMQQKLAGQLSIIQKTKRADRPGDQVDRYKLVAEHGRGGFGAVWRADDTKLGRRIALKRLSQQLARQSESRRRFINEARITARLEHPGIVPVYDISNLDEDHAYYTMKLVRGKTMAQAIKDVHELPRNSDQRDVEFRRILNAFLQVCQTMRYCHDSGVIHRDLKPQNVIIGDFSEAIVLDWGLACVVSSRVEGPSTEREIGQDQALEIRATESLDTGRSGVQGTPAYMAPEQARGDQERIGVHTDIYGLGAMLYHLLTGQPPFMDVSQESLLEHVAAGKLTWTQTPDSQTLAPLAAISRKAMSLEPRQRYEHVGLLSNDVECFLADRTVSVHHESIGTKTARWIRHHPTAVASIVLTILFLSVAVVASTILWQAKERRELVRLNEIRNRATRADAAAQSHLHASRFDAALGFWIQATEILQNESRFNELHDEIAGKRDRVSRIVDFYTLGHKAQEMMFFDQLRECAIYSQTALEQVGALDETDWWEHLPDRELTPDQIRDLREEIYRQLGLLATIRLAEQAESGFSLEWLTQLTGEQNHGQDLPYVSSAMLAANQANRFRPARSLQFVNDVGQLLTAGKQDINLLIGDPMNPTDAAMLGSILDTHAPRDPLGKMLLQPLLGMRDPDMTARQWLCDAVNYAPQWYWLSIFIGTNELRTEKSEDAIRSFSHAVGVEPNSWVAYLYRAAAHLQAARKAETGRQKQVSLSSAARDLQRARDLETEDSFLFWNVGYIATVNPDTGLHADQLFVDALQRHPAITQISGGHFTAVTQLYLDTALQFAEARLTKNADDWQAVQLRGMLRLWQNDLESAIIDLNRVHAAQPENLRVSGLLGVAQYELRENATQQDEAIVRMRAAVDGPAGIWFVADVLTKAYLKQERWADAQAAIDTAERLAIAGWQRGRTQISQSVIDLRTNNIDGSLEALNRAIRFDMAVEVSDLADALKVFANETMSTAIMSHLSRIAPRKSAQSSAVVIREPALLNGDFELGLSFDWGNVADRNAKSIWTNHGNFQSAAEISRDTVKKGLGSLHVNSSMGGDATSYGSMTQVIPVSPGVKYQITVESRASKVTAGSCYIGIGRREFTPVVELAPGSYDWQTMKGEFVAESNSVQLQIRITNAGEFWLDEMKLKAIE